VAYDRALKTRVISDPRELLESTKLLLQDEAKNNLILGLARGMIRSPELFDGARMFIVSSDTARLATADDLELVLERTGAFMDEALPGEPADRRRMSRVVERRLVVDVDAGVWLWEVDGRVVSMSGHSGPTGSRIRISGVYAQPPLRGNG
jgi:hypothetical protein